MTQLVLILHNIRSTHNVGSILRTADGLGVEKVIMSGYTPYPTGETDKRLPHISKKLAKDINKTALGAEQTIDWEHVEDVIRVIDDLRAAGYVICALEQTNSSIPLSDYKTPDRVALMLGTETTGIEPALLDKVDTVLEIPMRGKKESFNVAVAAAIAAYHLCGQ